MRPLAGAYAFSFSSLAPLYAGDPRSSDAWRETYERVRQRGRARSELADVLTAQQISRAAPANARQNASRLADAATVAVVTGQQAGLFGGPLFTLLKALNAIQLARRAEAALEVPVVPVFWVDAEDHDWEEIASATVLDRDLHPQTITLPAVPGAGEVPVAGLRLDERISECLSSLASALPDTDFSDWIMSPLRQAYTPGRGVAEAFARFLESLLGTHGLVVCDSSDPAMKPLVAGVFAREIASPGRTTALARAAGNELAARGHAPQVTPQPDALALLALDGARRPIRREGDQFVAGERTWRAEDLARDAASNPQRFSPNVLLRPIVQDTIFPTICYVAGPNELAYLGQLRQVYEHFGVPMPLIHPRATATLVDSATARFLSRYDVPLENLQPQDEGALNRLLEAQLPADVDAAFEHAGDAVRRTMHEVIDVVPRVDPTLAGAARTTLGRLEHELQTLRGKVVQAAKRRDETLRRQFRRAQMQTFPLGHPQERTVASVYFLDVYGPALIDRLLDDLPLDLGQHWVITI